MAGQRPARGSDPSEAKQIEWPATIGLLPVAKLEWPPEAGSRMAKHLLVASRPSASGVLSPLLAAVSTANV